MRIITDSTSDFTMDQANQMDISMLSLKVNLGGVEYIDKVEISSEDFYEKMKTAKNLPTTTLVSPDEFATEFAKYPDTPLVVITISSVMSGTFQSATIAKEQSGREDIYLVDTGTGSLGQGMLVREAVKMRDDGAKPEEIANTIGELSKRVVLRVALDTMHYLVMGGRVSNVKGFIGGIIGIKPLLTVSYRSLKATGKARGMSKAAQALAEFAASEADRSMPISFAHSAKPADLDYLKSLIPNSAGSEIFFFGSVIGAHVGPGAIAVAYFAK